MSAGAYIGIGLVVGGLLGFFFGRFFGRGRGGSSDSRLENDLQQRLAQREVEQRTSQDQLFALNKRNGELGAELKLLNERLATERQQLETIQEKFRKEFEAVSNKLILDNTSRFNQQSTESLGKLLAPLKETLGEFKTSLDTTRRETATHSALLKEQIGRIGTEAANLSKALKGDVKALGNWGENMLDQILEKSGLQRDVHYRRQRGARDVEGDQRYLDVIVELPEKRNLVIDSKVSLRAYEESVNAPDDAGKLAALDRHIEAIRKHFRDLGAKRYQDIHGINTPDFVLMYVPIEAAFFAAIARAPGLFSEALDENIVLITNSTLLATLRTVAHVWRLADQQKHVLEIADRGGKLYDKFVGFVEDLQAVGDALGKARKAWEDASTKLHSGSGNLISQTEKLKHLGAKAAKSLPNALLEKADEETPVINPKLRLPPET
ncbi:MAG TPA: DNA recombination protein RmuC [Alphaproteobacteria bacterium]|nr:DNA recombination protein RmuC [Alphaproteobacteria bacterium]